MHQKDIDDMKDEIQEIKFSLADLIDKIKPAFSVKDKVSFIISVFIYTIILTIYLNNVDNKGKNNEIRIDKIESKTDKIYDIVFEMNKKIK